MRILLDTNILISGLLSREGPPGQVLAAAKQQRHVLISSTYQVEEFLAVIQRKHLRHRVSMDDAIDLVESISGVGEILTELTEFNLSPDPKDNPILATAIDGKADLIVSGDKGHMIALGEVKGIPIVTAREAVARLQRE